MNQQELFDEFYKAAKNCNLLKVVSCVEQGVDVNARFEHGWTALHYAAESGYYDIVDYLLKHQANINITSTRGRTALQLASDRGHDNVATLLLENNADPNITNAEGNTALHLAVHHDLIDCVKALLRYGADVSIENIDGKTVFNLAEKLKDGKEMVDFLKSFQDNLVLNGVIEENIKDDFDLNF